jgi:Na+-translocating ferredoxin:NAD+ oxidoreductase RNF subunit RnfB
MTEIILAAVLIGATGIIIGLLLGFAGEKFAVEVDEKEQAVRELLPGNNCGGCGFAGCDALAKAIAAGDAPAGACPVGGEPVAEQIAAVMGVEAHSGVRKVAYVKCAGTCDQAERKYEYYGISDCGDAMVVPGAGDKACAYGCLGFGTCVKACPFDAIHIVNGVAKVDKEQCKACSKCVAACPKHLIQLVPENAPSLVQCSSHDMAKKVMEACKVGCRGCTLCAKVCPEGAITMDNFLAVIDPEKCTGCGLCKEKCPAKIIRGVEK